MAAVEFALIAPLLFLLLALAFEMAHTYQVFRSFEAGVPGIARKLTGFPEYYSRARLYAPPFAAVLLPRYWDGKINLQVMSLKKDNGGMREVFTHSLFETSPALPKMGAVKPSPYGESEDVIYLTVFYDYVLIFSKTVFHGRSSLQRTMRSAHSYHEPMSTMPAICRTNTSTKPLR